MNNIKKTLDLFLNPSTYYNLATGFFVKSVMKARYQDYNRAVVLRESGSFYFYAFPKEIRFFKKVDK